jgi:hypothetical protein
MHRYFKSGCTKAMNPGDYPLYEQRILATIQRFENNGYFNDKHLTMSLFYTNYSADCALETESLSQSDILREVPAINTGAIHNELNSR